MCDPANPARQIPSSNAAQTKPRASGFEYVNGKKVPKNSGSAPSYEAMNLFCQSDSEARNTRKPRASRGAKSSGRASTVKPSTPSAPEGVAPPAKGFASSNVASVPFSERASGVDWDIHQERGLDLPLTVCFNGSMNNFSKGQANVFGTKQPGTSDATFNPTQHNFAAADIAKLAHDPVRQDTLASDMAFNVACFSSGCASVMPLELRVESATNPLPFPVGIRCSHEPLNTVLCGSPFGQASSGPSRFAAILQPGTTSPNSVSDLRHNVDVPNIERVIKYNGVNPKNDVTMAGGMATWQVREDSATHEALQALVLDGKIAGVDFSDTTTIEGKRYIQGVPQQSAKEAMRLIEKTKKMSVGQMKLDGFKFTLHPLNHTRSWDDHHLSEASHDMVHNPAVYRDTVDRPVSISANLRLRHL